MTTNVLFMCPHSAGKSLAAATYFRAAAARRGVDVSIAVAGPEPDEVNMVNVEKALVAQGFTIGWTPKLVSADDTGAADLQISIGCEHDAIPTDGPITEWDSPLISVDLLGALEAIHDHAESLARQLTLS